jgi:hypothetical protein
MDRRIDWIVRNGAFAAALYFSLAHDVAWMMYGIAGFVWWTLATNVWALPVPSPSRPLLTTMVPPSCTMAFDLAVLAAMFLAHWYWTAFAYALSCGCLAVAQARAIRP